MLQCPQSCECRALHPVCVCMCVKQPCPEQRTLVLSHHTSCRHYLNVNSLFIVCSAAPLFKKHTHIHTVSQSMGDIPQQHWFELLLFLLGFLATDVSTTKFTALVMVCSRDSLCPWFAQCPGSRQSISKKQITSGTDLLRQFQIIPH